MSARAKKLRDEVLELPRKARAELARDLLLSLEDAPFDPPEQVEREWAEAIERRIQDVKDGRIKLIPADEVFRRVRANLKRVRAPRAR